MNAKIKVQVNRLNFPLQTLFARQFSAYRLKATGIPGDASGVFLRIVSADGQSFRDFPGVSLAVPGEWRVTVPALAFDATGDFLYELHGMQDGDAVALGRGRCVVQPFTPGDAAPSPGTPVTFAKMPTRDGGWVNCVAVMDETGEYTYEFERISEDGESAT